jgi:hypothetical protein
MNQMGEVAEVYTAEEKVILGEEPEPQAADQVTPPVVEGKKPPEGVVVPEGDKPAAKEPEHTEDEKAAVEKMGLKIDDKGFIIDDEGTRIPAKRWKKLYWEAQEAKRQHGEAVTGKTQTDTKFKLFRVIGPQKYYEIYPDEKPEGFQEEQKASVKADDPFNLVAQYPDPNHPLQGKTLGEIYQENPAEGRRLERQWEQGRQRQQQSAAEGQRRLLDESEREVQDFSAALAKDFFSKEAAALTKEEKAQVESVIQDTLDFMQKTKRGAGILADAYFVMNREKIVTEAKTKGGKAALESLQKPSIPAISAGAGGAGTGMDAYEAMNGDQLAKTVEGMTDKQYASFMKNASPALKAKHPSIPWD